MKYVLSYKGRKLGETMDRELAEAMLVQLSACFRGLEIVEAPLQQRAG
ncbi:hypothetical protein MJA45_05040 [Paenibacillus aurantius]|uniref:Uncharacterized protein n=1 Tax=Paenibacillus aurantius TaxID=2918900 RepID=A0AA96RGK0_9BACL|nr:hypothetical protein [Paenibacillus aurantius]WJH37063.1 hypothetical protein N6H14_16130 [Paenibacillus sp. CC-CFT747]WNQ12418.1 hypothetical protein MJA45_05040 [Paenibacillus aurantius]